MSESRSTTIAEAMLRSDALCDTTPAVTRFVESLIHQPEKMSPTTTTTTSSRSTSDDVSRRATGHVLLTSLMCVSRLARRRQLLLHTPQPAAERTATVSAKTSAGTSDTSPFTTADANTNSTMLVRLVLSLLGHTMMDATSAGPSSATACTREGATAGAAAALPWWSAKEAAATAERSFDVVYAVQCVDGDTAFATAEQLAFAPRTSTSTEAIDVGGARVAAAVHGLALRSCPVSVFSADLMEELAEDAQRCADVVIADSDSDDERGGTTRAAAAAAAASVVERARAVAYACFRQHEARCLQQLAAVVDALLLEVPPEPRSTDTPSAHVHAVSVCEAEARVPAEHAAVPPKWIVDVPIYGVALCVEDTHATRLARVRRLTSPLLLAASTSITTTRAGSMDSTAGPLSAVTHVLALLHSWCSVETKSSGGSRTGAATLTRVQLGALRDLITRYRIAWGEPDEGRGGGGGEARVTASAGLPPSPVPLGVPSCVSAAPACVVHCQLGVSRSPSVVLLYYMDLFAASLRHAAASAAIAAGDDDRDTAVLHVFHGLMDALVQARRRVRPNVCFAVQLLALWRQLCGTAG